MRSSNNIILSIFFLIAFSPASYAQKSNDKLVDVNGKKIAYKSLNTESRKEGEPIIVFETGLGGGTFDPILQFFPSNIASIQYARNGVGESEMDLEIISDSQVIERLRSLLKTLHIEPPYLLVGHSIGGPYIRLFAAKFPDEVCGLVFSDPTDFMLSSKENDDAKRKSKSDTGYKEVFLLIQKMMSENEGFSQGAKNDATRALKSSLYGYFPEYRDLPPLDKDIAATVIISYNKHIEHQDEEMNKNLNLGINFKPWWKEYDNLRIQHFSDLIKDNDNSSVILLPKYSHGIYYQNPKLVAKLIIENYNSNIKENK